MTKNVPVREPLLKNGAHAGWDGRGKNSLLSWWHSGKHWEVAPRWLALGWALWCTLVLNQAWWGRLTQLSAEQHLSALQSLVVATVLTAASALWFMLWSWPKVRGVAWPLTLVVAAAVQYFMLNYGVVVDASMVRNTLQTNPSEGWALVTAGLVEHVVLLAVVPWLIVTKLVKVRRMAWAQGHWKQAGWSALLVLACMAVVLGGGLWLYKPMAPLVRNHTEIRYLINPLATIVSTADVTLKPWFKRQRPFQRISEDAVLGTTYTPQQFVALDRRNADDVHGTEVHLPATSAVPLVGASTSLPQASKGAPVTGIGHKPPLLVLVVGETTRADHFGLNGYPRNTTPQMEARHVISWRNVHSCGTNTLASVPCMFSHLGKEQFEGRKVEYDNLLDVLQHAGLAVDWLDNQAGCKDVCNRVSHAQADQAATAEMLQHWCKDAECLDQLMVGLLDQRLQQAQQRPEAKGVVLVLHQMGSHGPAYYRRSSMASKQFQPECTTHVTADCSHSELVNVYDNSMMETDRFVARTIDWLQAQQGSFETALIYLSDHGESLGENGIYLHGLPYVVAPEAQTHVPWVLWPGTLLARTGVSESCLRAGIDAPLTHDHYYHTVLGLLDVRSSTYQPTMDAWASCR